MSSDLVISQQLLEQNEDIIAAVGMLLICWLFTRIYW